MINLEYGLRATETMRWTIVKFTRTQSVAEHQYNVWLIALALTEMLRIDMHNSFDAAAVEHWALTHDLQETFTGDVPAILKDVPTFRPVFEKVDDTARNIIGLPSSAAHKGTVVETIVSLADIVEALFFAHQNGGRDRPAVWAYLRERYQRTLTAAMEKHPALSWEGAPALFKGCSPHDDSWARALEEV